VAPLVRVPPPIALTNITGAAGVAHARAVVSERTTSDSAIVIIVTADRDTPVAEPPTPPAAPGTAVGTVPAIITGAVGSSGGSDDQPTEHAGLRGRPVHVHAAHEIDAQAVGAGVCGERRTTVRRDTQPPAVPAKIELPSAPLRPAVPDLAGPPSPGAPSVPDDEAVPVGIVIRGAAVAALAGRSGGAGASVAGHRYWNLDATGAAATARTTAGRPVGYGVGIAGVAPT